MKLNISIPGVDEQLVTQTYYHGLLQREDVLQLLKKNGQFLLRVTEPAPGSPQMVVISTMSNDRMPNGTGIKHYVIRQKDGKFHCERDLYDSIPELVETHVTKKIGLDPLHQVKLGKMVGRQDWELKNWTVDVQEKLGEGAFGAVCKGMLADKTPVAIKQATIGKLSKEQIKEVMWEARVMRCLHHPHIVKLHGIAALDEPLLIIMELASHGSLDKYLQKTGESIDVKKKANMCVELAWAMVYLQKMKILHRDVAARNCLLCGDIVKLSDFGKSTPGPIYQMDSNEILPIRWLSPETMIERKFSYASEVWSFGVTCWEIFSNGMEPYYGYSLSDVTDFVVQGNRMLMPDSTPETIKTMVERSIFVMDAKTRISMDEVADVLEKYANRQCPPASTKTNKDWNLVQKSISSTKCKPVRVSKKAKSSRSRSSIHPPTHI